jgi:uncharacterized membrane protein (UPF0127 family)
VVAVLVGLGAVLAACSSSPAQVTVGAVTLTVEVADSPQERRTGLSGREEVPPGTGMAFVFDPPAPASFWMADTLVPLSIMWVRDGRVLDVAEMQPCAAEAACPIYQPADPDALVDLAVEAPAGTFSDAGITPGTPVTTTGI